MQNFYSLVRTVSYTFLGIFIAFNASAQTPANRLSIRNFAVFGGFQIGQGAAFFLDSLNYGASFNSGNKVNGGAVGSYSFISTASGATLNANLFSGHRVNLGPGTSVRRNITAAINGRQSISVINTSGQVYFGNETPDGYTESNLTGNGNISLSSETYGIGTVRLPSNNSYSGPTPSGGVLNNPVFPQLPALPLSVPWGAPGTGISLLRTATINPGNYGSIRLGGLQTITFNGTGRYIFDSIQSTSGTQNTFVFDFKNNETGLIGLYINKNADLRNIKIVLLNGGSASRIYTEVHGTGRNNGYAFSIDGGNYTAQSNWEGTVWAPASKIRVGVPGSTAGLITEVNGCLWSVQMVTLAGDATVNYVPLTIADPIQAFGSPLLPYYPPPASGKVNKIIGSELQSLAENYNPVLFNANDFIYRIDKVTGKVLIEVIAKQGQAAQVLSLLTSTYGFTDIISNGEGSLVITGKIPITNLNRLNTEPISAKIDYCRPLFLPLTNSGLVTTLGDSAVKGGIVRRGYDLSGAGVKVGVISDSYAKAELNPATTLASDDLGVDLPPTVDVLLDYPFGTGLDEGRAMMQIVHDVAPGAALAFRTGFISAGDMAQGINQLANDCKIIVDDITFITEPFLKDGVVARAVNNVVTTKGVTYFSAAGNFGKKAYDGTFTGILPPGGVSGEAHNFGGGNYLQKVLLQPGNYTVVLQWFDDIYSLGETSTGGTHNDLDIYLVDDQGTILFGFNRVNIGGDPLEVLPFRVTGNVPLSANLMIVRTGGFTANLKFKYIVFRGDLSFTNYPGASTIVGQANAENAIAVGAVAYDKTPAFNVNPATIEDFSSVGGTLVNGVNRKKPDLTAPDRGNVTINIGPDYDVPPDGKANFFGTSAAAPHAAAVAALVKEGKQKFSAINITPVALRTLLKNSAKDIGVPGYDEVTGAGLVDAEAAMRTFATPQPFIGSLEVVEAGIVPGSAPFTISIKGSNISSTTTILFNNNVVTTSFVNSQEVRAPIPVFSGNPSLQLYTPPISSSNLDGGYSAKRFFNQNAKKIITITVDEKTKKFGQALPAFTSTVLVDGLPLAGSGLTLAQLKLNNLAYTTTSTTASSVGLYAITATNPLDPALPADQLLLDKYTYDFKPGSLQIQRLPLLITPKDKTIAYGDFAGDVTFTYTFDQTGIASPNTFEQTIRSLHKKFLADNALAVVNGFTSPQGNGSPLTNADIQNMSIIASYQSVVNARKFVIRGGKMEPLVGNISPAEIGLQRFLVDVSAQSIYNYNLNPASSALVAAFPGEHSRLLLNAKSLASGAATTRLGNGQLMAMVNGQLMAMVNGQLQAIVNGQLMAIVNGELVALQDVTVLSNGQLQAIVNGAEVIIPNGQLQAMVNGQLYIVANPVIVNGQLQAMVNGQLMAVVNGQLQAIVNGQLMPVVNGQLQAIVNGQLMAIVNGQLQAIVNGQLMAIVNGQLVVVTGVTMVNGQLQAIVNGQLQAIVNGQLQAIVNGQVYPVENASILNGQLQAIVNGQLQAIVNGQLQAIVNGQLQAIVNSNNLGGVNSNNKTAVIIDQDDISKQGGALGAMFPINMITGLDVGTQTLIPGAFAQENYDVTYALGKVTITAPTDFYTKATGNLHTLSTWGANPDGSGAAPSSFAADKTFHLVNRGSVYVMTGNLTIGGLLDIRAGSQLKLNGFSLSEAGLPGTGALFGTASSQLTITGATAGDAGVVNFAPGGEHLASLTINRTGTNGAATIGTVLNIFEVLTITKGKLNTGNKITLKSNSINTARVAPVGGTVSGNVTVERFLPPRRAWRIMSAPVGGTQSINAAWQEGATNTSAIANPTPGYGTHITQGSAVAGFDNNPGAAISVYKYISATDSWNSLANTNATAVNENAYLLFVRGDRSIPLGDNRVAPNASVLRTTGPLKTGNQTFAISAAGFTAIPNPYASPINFATLTRNNVQNNFYVWDPKLGGQYGVGGYVLISFNGSTYDITPAPVSPESQLIQSGQGFLVHSTGAAGSLIIKESDKSATAATNVFRSSNITKGLRITLNSVHKNSIALLDEAFESFATSFSNAVDNLDGAKLSNINENIGIERDGQTLMIERRREINGKDTIKLKLWNTVQQDYAFELNPVNLTTSSIAEAYLEDNYLKTYTLIKLTEITSVHFRIDGNAASADSHRFMIVLSGKADRPVDAAAAIIKSSFKISPNPLVGKTVNIQFIDQPRGTYKIEIMNAIGQVIYRQQLIHIGGSSAQALQLNTRITKGLYQVKVTNENSRLTTVLPLLNN